MKIKTDYNYSFSESVRDGLSRPLEFTFSKGRCERDETGILRTVYFDEDLSKVDQSKRLRTAIDSELSFSNDLMLQSFDKCMQIRNTEQPNAKMMVIGKDKEHLTKLSKYFTKATNIKPVVVHDGISNSHDLISRFKKSTEIALFSCKMCAEGTSIKPMRVLTYLTNITALSPFIQIVTRAVRKEKIAQQGAGYIYLPADPRLIENSKLIEDVNLETSFTQKEKSETKDVKIKVSSFFSPLSAEVTKQFGVYRDSIVTETELDVARNWRLKNPKDCTDVTDTQLAIILAKSADNSEQKAKIQENSLTNELETFDQKKDKLKKRINKIANKLAFDLKVDPADIHRRWISDGNLCHAEATMSDLENKLKWLNSSFDNFYFNTV